VGVLVVSNTGDIVFTNPKADRVFGYKTNELLACKLKDLIPKRFKKNHALQVASYILSPSEQAMGGGRILQGLMKNGEETNIEVALSPIKWAGEDYVMASVLEASNPVLKIAAYNDPLTGLANRGLFKELSEKLFDLAVRTHKIISVMVIDLDNFKALNDSQGHAAGDKVLCKVADILRNNIRKNDVAARIGGDEFTLFFYDVDDNETIERVASIITQGITALNTIKNKLNLSASIGIVTSKLSNDINLDNIVEEADKLMYEVKKQGKGKYIHQSYR